jgi:hypothetical protein
MSSALVAQPRSLDLPLGALFSPTEMQIGPSTSRAEYQKLGAGLRKLDNASELWTADFSLFGLRTWGREQGLQMAHDATGLSKFFLYKASFIAARFTPEHRLPGYKYSAYRELMPFPPEWAYAFLSRHVDEKLSSRSLRALAVKEFGSEPYKAKQSKKRSVKIRCELFARLAQHAPSRKVAPFIEQILEDYLAAAQSNGKTAPPASPSVGNDSQSTSAQPATPAAPETPRPSYTERREQQIADGAQPIPQKPPKKYSLKVQWTECLGESFVDTENGAVSFRAASREKPTVFWSENDAIAAEEEHFKQCGFREKVVHCNSCSLRLSSSKRTVHIYHVAHIYSGREHA